MGSLAEYRRNAWRVLAALSVVAATAALGTPQAQAIAGGSQVGAHLEAPWMATLVVKGTQPLPQRSSCGGALVAADQVLTAAHCVYGVPPDELARIAEIHIGATVLSRDSGQVAGIAGVQVHPQFQLLHSPADPDNPEADSAAYDIAVIKLDRRIAGVRPLAVAGRAPLLGSPAVFYGHGITGPPNPADPDSIRGDVLRRGLYLLAPDGVCAPSTPAQVDARSMLCGRGLHAQACFGDSGGPLLSWRAGRPEIVGIFSFGMETAGQPCGSPGPNFFTDVSVVRAWVLAPARTYENVSLT